MEFYTISGIIGMKYLDERLVDQRSVGFDWDGGCHMCGN
jgi:hypothetical protein